MIINQKITYHLSMRRNKLLCFFILLLLIYIAITGFYRYVVIQSPIYSKLQGYYEFVYDSLYVYRSYGYDYPTIRNLKVDGDKILLPFFHGGNSVKKEYTYQDLKRDSEARNGSWKSISYNPDSIFINAKGHILHGKYRVLFITDSVGYVVKLTTDYIILENDSTHLCLKRVK